MAQMEYWGKFAGLAMESCPTKCALSGAAGLALGGFFSLMGATLAMDDPLRRTHMGLAPVGPGGVEPPKMSAAQQTKIFFKEMGAGMWRSGKGFGKVGALYAGIECCIEGVSIGFILSCGSGLFSLSLCASGASFFGASPNHALRGAVNTYLPWGKCWALHS